MARAHMTTHAPLMLHARDYSWASSLPRAAEAVPRSYSSLFAIGGSRNTGHCVTEQQHHTLLRWQMFYNQLSTQKYPTNGSDLCGTLKHEDAINLLVF